MAHVISGQKLTKRILSSTARRDPLGCSDSPGLTTVVARDDVLLSTQAEIVETFVLPGEAIGPDQSGMGFELGRSRQLQIHNRGVWFAPVAEKSHSAPRGSYSARYNDVPSRWSFIKLRSLIESQLRFSEKGSHIIALAHVRNYLPDPLCLEGCF